MANRFQSVILHAAVSPAATRDRLLGEPVSAGGRTVTVTLETLLPATEVSAHFCRSVARSALALWPNWYDGRLNSGFALSQASDTALAAAATSAEREWEVGLAWLRGAILACSRGALPLPGGFTDIDHLCQLAMVFGRHPRLLVTVPEQAPRVERLDALARFLVGLSEKTSFRVEFIVPAALAGSADLDPVNYPIAPPASAALSVDSEDGAAAADEPSATISAEAGRPHPESPGEQRLADWLAREWTLGPLFRFNQTVRPFVVRNTASILSGLRVGSWWRLTAFARTPPRTNSASTGSEIMSLP